MCYTEASRLACADHNVLTTTLSTLYCFTHHFEVKAEAARCRDNRSKQEQEKTEKEKQSPTLVRFPLRKRRSKKGEVYFSLFSFAFELYYFTPSLVFLSKCFVSAVMNTTLNLPRLINV